MIVNQKKTGLGCISAATSFRARAHLRVLGEEITSVEKLKVLGFFFDSDGGVWSQVSAVCARLRSRSWALTKLRKCGLTAEELVRVYKSSIRPCVEYAAVVLHPMLSAEQTDCIEAQQTQALRNIFGFGVSVVKMRKRAGIPTLSERRRTACIKFAADLSTSTRFCHWMERRPETEYPRRQSVTYGRFIERVAKTARCYNSPLFYYRRLLNGRSEL